MRKIDYSLVVVLLFLSFSANAQLSYKSGNRTISLTPDKSLSFKYVQPKNMEKVDLTRGLVPGNKKISVSDNYISQIYKTTDGSKIIILPKIVLRADESIDVQSIIDKYDINLSILKTSRRKFVLKGDFNSSEEVVKVANEIASNKGILWCVPGMYAEISLDNTYWSEQYNLKNTGQNGGVTGIDINVEPAWQITEGSSDIVVAVIDDGVQNTHEDMSGRVLQGYTIGNPLGNGAPQNANFNDMKAHGTACAGIIAANNNNIGIRGITSNVKVLPVNIFPDYYQENLQTGMADPSDIADAIDWAASRADVISCSWHIAENEEVKNAIEDALNNGRNGKGCVVVSSSGTFNYSTPYVRFPASVNGVIAIGSISRNGIYATYSGRGPELDLVAPGDSIRTIDLMGSSGYSIGNYRYFTGTSASCPQVSGIAALMLSANPNLSSNKIITILKSTARKLPDMSGADRTDKYGYGLVDAYAAVNFADLLRQCENVEMSGPSMICHSSIATYSLSGLPADATVCWTFTKTYGEDSPQISPNSTNNTCKIYHLQNSLFEGVLKAEITIQGYNVVSLTKRIIGDAEVLDSYAFYYDGEPVDWTTERMLTEDDNWATPSNTVYVTAPNLYNKTVKLMRSTFPNYWWYPMSYGQNGFRFEMPDLMNGETLTIRVTGGCQTENFIFVKSNTNYMSSLNVKPLGDGRYILSFGKRNQKAETGVQEATNSNQMETAQRKLHVYSAESSHMIFSIQMSSDSYVLETNGWSPGVYVIKTLIDNKICSAKITVK